MCRLISAPLYVYFIVSGVLCHRSGHNHESPTLQETIGLPSDLDSAGKTANNYYKINYYYPSLPNQNYRQAEISRDKDPPGLFPALFPIY
ncbi:hypothetical protein WDU94_004525, partial [Cyamophila willieti]